MRTPQSQHLHDSVVSARARQLVGEGESVWADVPGYRQPQLIFGFMPDIIANGRRNLISEVETSDSYSSDHTYNQLRAFDSATNYSLEVVVPQSVYDAARRLYQAVWGVSVDLWQTF
jgi:hypothetical protein